MSTDSIGHRYKRVALIIGNSNYSEGKSLANPINDAELMTATLERQGFKIVGGAKDDAGDGADCNREKIYALISELEREVEPGGTALIYYAGHGIQIADENYMVPIGANLRANDPRLELVAVRKLVDRMATLAGPSGTVIVFLDACRNNPIPERILRELSDKVSTRSAEVQSGVAMRSVNAGGGLSTFKLTQADRGARKFIALATAPGDVAYDGDPDTALNSPFAEALSRHLSIRGLDLDSAYRRVARDVSDAVGRMGFFQEPWRETNFTEPYYVVPNNSLPIIVLGLLGAVAGLIVALFLFQGGEVVSLTMRPWVWVLGAPFGIVAAVGTMLWGSRRPWNAGLAFLGPVLGFILALALLYLVPSYPVQSSVAFDPVVTQAAQNYYYAVAIGSGVLFLIGTAITKLTRKVVRTDKVDILSEAVDWSLPLVTTFVLLALLYFLTHSSPFHTALGLHALAAGVIYASSAVIACKPQRAVFDGFGAFTGAIAVGILVAVFYAAFVLVTSKYYPGEHAEPIVLAAMCALWHGMMGAQLGYCFTYYVAEHER
ncbi:MAG: caspase domain-containing protein [Hyphomicrobiaceae bacterium]